MSNCETNSVEPSVRDVLDIANRLITQCNLLVPEVINIADINSNLIVLLFEKITGLSVSDSYPGEEANNIQSVINSLSSDVLQLSLSHINGREVAARDTLAMYNLLHVLEGILHHSSSRRERKFHKRRRSKRQEVPTSREKLPKQKVPLSLTGVENIFEKNAQLKLQTEVLKGRLVRKPKSFLVDRNHLLQQMQPPENKPNFPRPCDKSYLLPYTLRRKMSKNPSPKKDSKKRKPKEREERGTHRTTGDHHHHLLRSPSNFIQELLDEFPCVQISPSILGKIEKMYAHQIKRMLRIGRKCLGEKSKAAVEAENIFQKQFKLAEILKKDMQKQKYLREVREKRDSEMKIRCSLRDSRMKSAKMKQYTDEFVLEMRKKMLSAATNAEEQILKRVFEEVMAMQGEHVDDLCQQVREARTGDDMRYLNYLNSLENQYQAQYLALAEEIANERSDTQLRLRDEKEAFSKTEREFREKLKREIRFMQQVIVKQTEDTHFRKMDADLYVEEKRRQLRPRNCR